jgi:aryl-alcohol dehydrogenase-like predicted oxidoreductase
MPSSAFPRRPFGSTQLLTSAIGLGSSYGLSGKDVQRAYDRGINLFFWGSLRKDDFGRGVRELAQKNRKDMVVAVQSYTRMASLMEWSLDRALRALGTDYVDLFCLAWWNDPAPRRILDRAVRLREKGKARHIMVSCHNRPAFQRFLQEPAYEGLMVRYNAAHPGAEREVFPHLPSSRPGVLAFTATRWGTLVKPSFVPPGEPAPRAADCYRFALSNPNVDACLSGPRDHAELEAAFETLEKGPLDEEGLAWMRRVGMHVHESTKRSARAMVERIFSKKQLPPAQA